MAVPFFAQNLDHSIGTWKREVRKRCLRLLDHRLSSCRGMDFVSAPQIERPAFRLSAALRNNHAPCARCAVAANVWKVRTAAIQSPNILRNERMSAMGSCDAAAFNRIGGSKGPRLARRANCLRVPKVRFVRSAVIRMPDLNIEG